MDDLTIKRCLVRKENVVIQGTLSWEGLPPRYSQLLALYEYSEVTVLDIEVEQHVALERAFNRWSTGRINTIEGRCDGEGPENQSEFRRVLGDYTTPIPGYLKDRGPNSVQP